MRRSLKNLVKQIKKDGLVEVEVVFDDKDVIALEKILEELCDCKHLLKIWEAFSRFTRKSEYRIPQLLDFCLIKHIIINFSSVLENKVYANKKNSEKIGIEFLLVKIEQTGKNSEIIKKIRDILKEEDFTKTKETRHNMCHLFLEDKSEEINRFKLEEMINDVIVIFLILDSILKIDRTEKSSRKFYISKLESVPELGKYFEAIVKEYESMLDKMEKNNNPIDKRLYI